MADFATADTRRQARADKKRMHLLGFVLAGLTNHTQGVWAHPRHHVHYQGGFARPPLWQDIGRILERAKFDALFIADVLAPYTNYKGSSDTTVRHAVQWPVHDPTAIVPVVGCATKHLGIGLTLSTSFLPPYHVVRQISTLEHLTDYRIGWNIVTSYAEAEFQAMGLERMVAHDERYDRAEEFLQICYQLWDAWADGAIVRDVEKGVFADPDRVSEVNFQGKYLRCKTRPFTLPLEPHRRPVLWQAGASGPGRDFAARHADSVFQVAPTVAGMRSYVDDISARVDRAGRRARDVKVIFGVQPIVGQTREEARAKHDEIRENMPMDGILTIMSGHIGLDFSQLDLDEDLRKAESDSNLQGIRGLLEAILSVDEDDTKPLTLRRAAYHYGMSVATPILVGTPSDVADELEYLLDEGGGDGFMVFSTFVPGCFVEFCDLVVPELQKRGRFRTQYRGTTLRHHLSEY